MTEKTLEYLYDNLLYDYIDADNLVATQQILFNLLGFTFSLKILKAAYIAENMLSKQKHVDNHHAFKKLDTFALFELLKRFEERAMNQFDCLSDLKMLPSAEKNELRSTVMSANLNMLIGLISVKPAQEMYEQTKFWPSKCLSFSKLTYCNN